MHDGRQSYSKNKNGIRFEISTLCVPILLTTSNITRSRASNEGRGRSECRKGKDDGYSLHGSNTTSSLNKVRAAQGCGFHKMSEGASVPYTPYVIALYGSYTRTF